jgi:hypothetical protein
VCTHGADPVRNLVARPPDRKLERDSASAPASLRARSLFYRRRGLQELPELVSFISSLRAVVQPKKKSVLNCGLFIAPIPMT